MPNTVRAYTIGTTERHSGCLTGTVVNLCQFYLKSTSGVCTLYRLGYSNRCHSQAQTQHTCTAEVSGCCDYNLKCDSGSDYLTEKWYDTLRQWSSILPAISSSQNAQLHYLIMTLLDFIGVISHVPSIVLLYSNSQSILIFFKSRPHEYRMSVNRCRNVRLVN